MPEWRGGRKIVTARYRDKNRANLRAAGRQYWRDNPSAMERAKAKRRTPEGKQKRREERLRAIARNPNYLRNKHLKEKYGVTLLQYNQMMEIQCGVCAICGTPPRADRGRGLCLEVDHSHTTNAIRALLCRRCNTLVGYLEMDGQLLQQATEYIERFKQCRP